MSASDWLGLLGVFLGGALPWLEAVLVIPAGILSGLPPTLVVVFGSIGNLLTVALSAWFGESVRGWHLRRRHAKESATDSEESIDRKAATRERRRQRVQRTMDRGGMPLLALLGPLTLGTQFSAVAAVALGVPAMRTTLWIGGGTVLWALIAAAVTLAGGELFTAGP